MTHAQRIPVDDCQPTQLLLSAAKLRGVLEWVDPEDENPQYDPILVCEPERLVTGAVDGDDGADLDALERRYVVLDGHTRAFVAHCCGAETLRVEVAGAVDHPETAIYARCVEWCLEAGIETPGDLVGRIVSHERYLEEWVGRCHDLEWYSDGDAGSESTSGSSSDSDSDSVSDSESDSDPD